MTSTHPASAKAVAGQTYRAVWRWHFYAGIIVAPFAIFLAITGALYLWKPQYEAWRYRDLLTIPVGAEASAVKSISADAQLAAARSALPAGLRAQSFQPAFAAGETTQFVFRAASVGSHVPGLTIYMNPHRGTVAGQLRDDATFMQNVKELHGTLLAGRVGKYVVELAASWALVLFLTGLYLAWPRPQFTVRGFLIPRIHDPRLREPRRMFWRDLHVVPAVWCASGTIFLLSTGLLWTQGAGSWYRKISAALGQGTPRESSASAHRSALAGWSPPLKAGLAAKVDGLASTPPADEHAGHSGGSRHRSPVPAESGPYPNAISLDRVLSIAAERSVPRPFVVALPVGPTGVYSVISDRNQPFKRTYLHLDQYSGAVLAEIRFKDFGYLAQFFSWGIIAHEGQLFGLANQILGTLIAGGVVLLGFTGLAMWWQRRPGRRLAAPRSDVSVPRPVWIGTLVLAGFLPLLAGSLAVVFAFDRMVGRRWANRDRTAAT